MSEFWKKIQDKIWEIMRVLPSQNEGYKENSQERADKTTTGCKYLSLVFDEVGAGVVGLGAAGEGALELARRPRLLRSICFKEISPVITFNHKFQSQQTKHEK